MDLKICNSKFKSESKQQKFLQSTGAEFGFWICGIKAFDGIKYDFKDKYFCLNVTG